MKKVRSSIWAFAALAGFVAIKGTACAPEDARVEQQAKEHRAVNAMTLEQRRAHAQQKEMEARRVARAQLDEEHVLRFAREVRASMKNPKSFQLEAAIKMPDGAVCFSYRATNAFNAVVPGMALVLPNEQVIYEDTAGFAKAWRTMCKGREGADVSRVATKLSR